MVGILKRSELSLEKNCFAFLIGVVNQLSDITDKRLDSFFPLHHFIENLICRKRLFMIEVGYKDIFDFKHTLNFGAQRLFIKQLADLETDFCIFIGIERSDSGLS